MFREWKKLVDKRLKVIDFLITVIVIGISVFLLFYWKHIPEQVPLHWNFAGEIDDYSDAGSYIMLVIMMYFFFAGHMITKIIPSFDLKENLFGKELIHKVSKEKEAEAMNVLLGMLWVCDLLVQMIFAYIILCGVFLRDLGVWFLPLMMILLTADFVCFFIRMMKIKNSI